MLRFIIRRLLWTVLTVVVIMFITFFLFEVLPTTDPARLRAGRNPTPELIASIRHQLKLDHSIWWRFDHYVWGVFTRFDLGNDFFTNESVRKEIFERLPVTLFLVIGAAVMWFTLGVIIGLISSTRRGTFLDRFAMGGALVAISAPVYWLGLVSLYLFSSDIGTLVPIFPGSGSYDNYHTLYGHAWSLFLPWLVLSASFAAIYARLLRSNMLETLSEDYIRTARAKGLTERRVVIRHALRAAITPIITVLGLDIGVLVGSTILTETVFSIPGVGVLNFNAISRGNVSVVQGLTLFFALAVCIMNLVVDVLYAYLDPRIRY